MKLLIPRLAFCVALCIIGNISYAQIRTKQEKGYFNITNFAELHYLKSLDSSTLKEGRAYTKGFGFSASTVNGVFLNSNVSVGLGVGLQFSQYKPYPSDNSSDSALKTNYFDKKYNLTLLPIFADFRFYPSNYRNDLVFLLDVGYAPLIKIKNPLDKADLNGGPLIKLGAGYKIELGDVVSFLPTVNFGAQRFGDNTVVSGNIGLGLMF